ncbi:hypothetical protein BHE74_00009320 [Ensete ventricosum]|uniref:Cyanobacterial aminoacyl-tRNA synthetase CAAD domain-containing protein n=1 Tax=Ensete ventricosum TaxID=4639 RepID=A0A426ZAY7_ENSVE|nr:hypothetical protein B296_00016648 [Ensete ventricosum]RWW82219.1 hypothetical protein BHE74_00009320 [Ensete ventricosum]RZR86964.1 hypothetical protein BHM03_00014263 [Ensete ventricosum]
MADHCRFSSLRARATSSSEESSGSGDELLADLKEKLPKIMELVGLGYTGWFVYRYLLFKVSLRFFICSQECSCLNQTIDLLQQFLKHMSC